ncbi:hydroxymethylglutaryl-CoA reductase, degradative [Lactobacillus kefiranofaciens subsp. kefirgranum]|uniref:hydroxymethylglutaryl-CoA reductase, degradative n=1 Tax=Lactobacillus kefiranofaciens TaxID=267818 RepID=UPI0006EEB969|nr:hydroxymethylglutaryl-CoA reductase, degradative [Lactobacillus kefiranofaciens]KRL24816.1 hydroxymethylglutaryl-coA reductase [Lactobacillus kefiranofaciens subsp. kefirgranum DSM 10550 = JCM 8572]MCJ2171858.1 hydroxymethylglutaryl-CoA reductase, degradative [Lactobacillus kefiranofaciens]MCP9330809.1 hydroxymethylglutaryl-CoA reductase, degradative [Lactobacillus kefiranofaciens]MDF4142439.1 hydroxymethylglutaryl-CoA reductase, degradative [Lactobacillus kefiranofaciens]PAK98827.1 hydroxy
MKFYQLTPKQRREILQSEGIKLEKIDDQVLARLDQLSENVIGQLRLPLGVVQNLQVNGHKYWVPMTVEEPSVVAAANHGANIFAQNGGVQAVSKRDGIYGQIVLRVNDDFVLAELENAFPHLIALANQKFASLVKHGGGTREITAKQINKLVYLRVLVDPAEAMGANKTNSILEFLSTKLVELPGVAEKLFAILSNYPSQLTTAKVKLDPATLGGKRVAERIALLSKIGYEDPYRAVTNNKGIMNGADAVLLATGNDYRAIESATAVLASQTGQYRSLSKWTMEDGLLVGELTLPMAIGVVGGSIKAREDVQQSFAILGQVTSKQLAEIITGVALANNLAALLAISTVGIQAGHMKLQARNFVTELDANADEKKQVLAEMIARKDYSESYARKILQEIRKDK